MGSRLLLAALAVAAAGTCFAQASSCERTYQWTAWLQRGDGKWDTTANPMIVVCESAGVMRGVGFLAISEPGQWHWLSADNLREQGWSLDNDRLTPLRTEEAMSADPVSFNPADNAKGRGDDTLVLLNELWSRQRAKMRAASAARADDFPDPSVKAQDEGGPDPDQGLPPGLMPRPLAPRFVAAQPSALDD